jgi:hypothetical protein
MICFGHQGTKNETENETVFDEASPFTFRIDGDKRGNHSNGG